MLSIPPSMKLIRKSAAPSTSVLRHHELHELLRDLGDEYVHTPAAAFVRFNLSVFAACKRW